MLTNPTYCFNRLTIIALNPVRLILGIATVILLFLFLLRPVQAQDPDPDADTLLTQTFGWMAYPYAFYTPETQVALGAGGLLYFKTSTGANIQPSKVLFSGYYTTNAQYLLRLNPVVYFTGAERFYTDVDFRYGKEISKYYGIGPDTEEIDKSKYEMNSFQLNAYLLMKSLLFTNTRGGIRYEFNQHEMIDIMQNPNLESDSVTGRDGGRTGGLGLTWQFDTRDNIFYPDDGQYLRVAWTWYGRTFGGEFTFEDIIVDYRAFYDVGRDQVLGFQAYGHFMNGDPPFYKMPALGGSQRMRGFFEGRFRDRNYMMTQLEYRTHLFWRIGAAAFGSVGDVSHLVRDFRIDRTKFALGAGLRFLFDEEQKMNIRADIGFADDGSTGIYFSVEEAF